MIVNHSCYPENAMKAESRKVWLTYAKTYQAMDFVGIREHLSYDLLKEVGIDNTLTFDCLPLYIRRNYTSTGKKDGKTAVIASSVSWRKESIAEFGKYIDWLDSSGYTVKVLYGAKSNMSGDDQAFVQALKDEAGKKVTAVNAKTMDTFLSTIDNAGLFVSGRFHHTIAAATLGTPFVMLESNTPKNRAIAETFEAPRPLMYVDPDLADSLKERTTETMDTFTDERRENLAGIIDAMCERALINFEAL
jgi:polysaccharide pyruvyl transferase WcaK-like protein